MNPSHQRNLPLEISARCSLVTLEVVRNLRGCDAESVLDCVGDATHPKFLRWVFNVAVDVTDARRRELRFWRDEVLGGTGFQPVMSGLSAGHGDAQLVKLAIDRILGQRKEFPRGEIEIAWTINAMTVGRLVRAGELTEINRKITRESLAEFLKRRLQ